MDKSMAPLIIALVAVVAAGAALPLQDGGEGEYGEPPSGTPPGHDAGSRFEPSELFLPTGVTYMIELKDGYGASCYVGKLKLDADGEVKITDVAGEHVCIETLSPGKGTVTAACPDGSVATCEVTVVQPSMQILGTDSLILDLGQKVSVGTKLQSPANTEISWTVSDQSKCKISVSEDGRTCVVTSLAIGECFVIAKAGQEVSACRVTTTEPAPLPPVDPDGPVGPAVPADTLLDKTSMLLFPNVTSQISANTEADWSVSDGTVCHILVSDDGKTCTVTGIKSGTCVVTATSGTVSESCSITVK